MAIDGNRSNFNAENDYTPDKFKEMFELSSTDVASVQEYKRRKADGLSTQEALESLDLANKIITSEDWNLLLHAMYNLQVAYKDKGLNEIQTTVEDYVSSYTEEQKLNDTINEKVDTTIENLLLTNATQILISETQPNVIEGALWLRPKTT